MQHHALLGANDVALEPFDAALRPMAAALDALGGWTALATREIANNLAKIETSAAFRAVRREGQGEPATLSRVLRAEAATGLHAGSTPAEESAAMGCVWLCRFLRMWVRMWHEPRPRTFKEAVDAGYRAHIEAHHHWMLQRAFAVATTAVPTWEQAGARLAAFDSEGEAGVLRCVAVLEAALERIEGQLTTHGLEL